MSEAYAWPGRDQRMEKVGHVILLAAAFLSALLVIAGLIYATGTSARHKAAIAAAGCEPALFISGLPCTTGPMIASHYQAIATPATQQLNTEMAAYAANERDNLAAAEADLSAAVATEQAFDNSLAAMTFTPQNKHTADVLIQNATSDSTTVPQASALFTPQLTAVADALIRANQALAALLAQQARSSSLTQLRSFNYRVQVADEAVQAGMKLILRALHSPPPGA
jgi:hypothetical protein